MCLMSRTNCLLAIALIFFLFTQNLMAFGFTNNKAKDEISSQTKLAPKADLTTRVRTEPDDQYGVYSEAIQLLKALQGSPSCNRIAASSLLDSCHAIDGSKRDAESSLEDIRSIYAARLAMCEIVSADSILPQDCKSLVPVPNTDVQKVTHIRKGQLVQCLRSLESRPQWWTSYSNNRQNAVVMCQAARVDIEKDELIKLHTSVVKTNANANAALDKATREANAALMQLQNDFDLAKQNFQHQLLQELDLSTAQAQTFLERLVSNMDKALQNALIRIISTTKDVETDVLGLRQNIGQAKTESAEFQENIGKVFKEVIVEIAKVAATQSEQWNHNQDLVSQMQGSLQNLRTVEVGELLVVFHSIHNQLQTSNEIVTSLHTRQNELDTRLLNLDKSFANLESQAQVFSAAQTHQAELQTRMNDELKTDIWVAQEMVKSVTLSASGLKTTVEDTSSKLAALASLAGGVGQVHSWWKWILATLSVYLINRKCACFMAALLGITMLLNDSKIPFTQISLNTRLVHHASGFEFSLLTVLQIVAVIALILGLCYFLHTKRSSSKSRLRRWNAASALPSLGSRPLKQNDCSGHV